MENKTMVLLLHLKLHSDVSKYFCLFGVTPGSAWAISCSMLRVTPSSAKGTKRFWGPNWAFSVQSMCSSNKAKEV